MEYRCEATSVAGFVQQLAVAYVGRGYFFYIVGEIPERKDPHAVDEKLIAKYGLGDRKDGAGQAQGGGARKPPIPPLPAAPSCFSPLAEGMPSLKRRADSFGTLGRCRSSSADTPSATGAAIRMCGLSSAATLS